MKRHFAVSRCRKLRRNAKTIAVLVGLFFAQFAYAGNDSDSTLRLDLNEKTIALQRNHDRETQNISVERRASVEQITAPQQAPAQSEQSNTTEAEPKAPATYEADLMRRMGFAEKEIARGAEREHNWRIEHEKAQADYFLAQVDEETGRLRALARENPAYNTPLQLGLEGRKLVVS